MTHMDLRDQMRATFIDQVPEAGRRERLRLGRAAAWTEHVYDLRTGPVLQLSTSWNAS